MTNHQVVTPEEWGEARKQLLAKEKEFTKLRDQLSQARRDLPWVRVTKQYVFEGAEGKQALGQLFSGRSQLIVYHFMFGPDWETGCKSCSFWADNFNGIVGQRTSHGRRKAHFARPPGGAARRCFVSRTPIANPPGGRPLVELPNAAKRR